ncbi:hypothetical protein JCM10908_006349 [Rhodotorula pacifica]|uniref:OST5 family protein n=1 Tax=Rhodotorula pacifica TaxID=1495444 RepID=UPI0031815670
MSSSYAALAAEHASSPAFSPLIPRAALQPLAILLLVSAFILTFAFSTIRPNSSPASKGNHTLAREVALGGVASIAGGVGLVLAFCAIGANV